MSPPPPHSHPEEDESGPSTSKAPVFKKRSRPAKAAAIVKPAGPTNGSSGEAAEHSEDDEDDGDEEVSVADLIALRNLQRKPTGIELEKLNKGLRKKKKKAKKDGPKTEEDRWKEQMEKGGLVRPGSLKAPAGKDDEDDEEEGGGASGNKARNRLARQDNFQGETNAIDVDKHMMAYIEEEMRKRRAALGEGGDNAGAAGDTASQARAVLSNPEDELYKVAEKYTRLQQEARNAALASKLLSTRSRPDDEEGEGSVGLSSAMLSGIPEVELGMDSRLKNIEDTERAKRLMREERAQRPRRNDEEGESSEAMLAKARFFSPRNQTRSDAQALAEARAEASGQPPPQASSSGGGAGQKRSHSGGDERRNMASDELVMQRFKKRQMNQMKR